MGKTKYFIAIVLKDKAALEAQGLKEEIRDKCGLKAALRSPAHITLHRPFDWPTGKEDQLIASLSTFRYPTSFDIALSGFGHFEDRVVYIDVKASDFLADLHRSLARFARSSLGLFNEVEDKRGFHPHVTLAFRDLKKKHFSQVWALLQRFSFHHEISVSGFSLLRLEERWVELQFFPMTQR